MKRGANVFLSRHLERQVHSFGEKHLQTGEDLLPRAFFLGIFKRTGFVSTCFPCHDRGTVRGVTFSVQSQPSSATRAKAVRSFIHSLSLGIDTIGSLVSLVCRQKVSRNACMVPFVLKML